MPFLNAMAAVLAWLGRQGTRALAAMIFIGIAAPVFGTLLKPFVPQAVFVLLILAFLRVDPAAVRAHLRRPGLVIAISLWTMLALPALLLGAYALIGLPLRSPGLFLALALQAVASPMMSSPAIAGRWRSPCPSSCGSSKTRRHRWPAPPTGGSSSGWWPKAAARCR